MSLADRIKEAMGEMTRAQLARACGVSQGAVTQWLDGTTKNLKSEVALAMEAATNYRALWITSGKGPKRVWRGVEPDSPDVTDVEPKNVIPLALPSARLRRIPVVGTARMGEQGFYEELSAAPGAGDGYIEITTADPNAFVLRVRGTSMAPAIRDGWYVIVEPNATPAPGEYVLVKLRDGQKMVKELLIQRPGSIEIMSVNGGERRTIYPEELESMLAVVAVVSPSKWQPG